MLAVNFEILRPLVAWGSSEREPDISDEGVDFDCFSANLHVSANKLFKVGNFILE